MSKNNPWDDLSNYFETPGTGEEIPGDVADNVLIAWPVLLEFLERYLPKKKGARILDFGCGTGSFTSKLSSLTYQAIGLDPSPQMIEAGHTHFGPTLELHEGSAELISDLGSFDAVVAVMSLQFVPNIGEVIDRLKQCLLPKGLLVFAVFNHDYVTDCIQQGSVFSGFDSRNHPTKGLLELNSIKIPTYIRTASKYNELICKNDFECLLESYPPFTKFFIEKYPDSGPYTTPEFMILGYRKANP